jgi:hypothetical protein
MRLAQMRDDVPDKARRPSSILYRKTVNPSEPTTKKGPGHGPLFFLGMELITITDDEHACF